MPCFGSRKKSKRRSMDRPASVESSQIRQEYNELKSKQSEHLDVIARQSAELEELRQKLESTTTKPVEQSATTTTNDELELQLAEKEQMLRDKERQLEELQLKWKEMDIPSLDKVTQQLADLKKANEEAVKRLEEKEKEIATLRAQLNSSQSKDQERQKRLNRLTMDLESDRLMIQKLEELNQQLEAQKRNMAEKDLQHQQSLSELRAAQEKAIQALERKQAQTLQELQQKHEKEAKLLRERLESAEKRAKSSMNDEVEKLLREFEQSQHNHQVQIADLQKSHQEQMSAMRQGQQDELRRAAQVVQLRKTGGPGTSTLRCWPPVPDQQVEITPRDPSLVQLYISSVSANPTIKRHQEAIQTALTTKQIKYQIVDVAKSEPALQHMRKGPSSNKKLPQIFVGGEYRGQLEDLEAAIEKDQLQDFLKPRSNNVRKASQPSLHNEPVTPTLSSGISTASFSTPPTTPRIPPPTYRKSTRDEDDALFKEMEKELGHTDFSKIDLNI